MRKEKVVRRRHYFINRSVQLRYMGMVAVLIFIVSVSTGWMVYSSIWGALIDRLEAGPGFDEILLDVNRSLFVKIFLMIFAGMCASAAIMMFVSHRIAGPLLRFRKLIAEIGEGEIPQKIRFREKDEFKELAEALNSLIQKLEDIKVKNKKTLGNVYKLLGEGGSVSGIKNELDRVEILGEQGREA